jgi:hypothetical protein
MLAPVVIDEKEKGEKESGEGRSQVREKPMRGKVLCVCYDMWTIDIIDTKKIHVFFGARTHVYCIAFVFWISL